MPNIQSKEDRYIHTSHTKCQISRAKNIDTYILVIVNAKYSEQRRYILVIVNAKYSEQRR